MKLNATIKNYIAIARIDHWSKHVFILPGIVLAFALTDYNKAFFLASFVPGIISACLLASANYVINEWSDSEFDQFHPIKKFRPGASGALSLWGVAIEYVILLLVGLLLAASVSLRFFIVSGLFVFMGFLYNIKPFRLKDRVFLDVLTESINNPLRLFWGWFLVSDYYFPPVSLVAAYWFGGAFLMTAKRLAEFRFLSQHHELESLKAYRKSFRRYTEHSLLVACFLYALLSSSLTAAFFIKHRNEFLFVFPLVAILFAYYFSISLKETSTVQTPEKLYDDKGLILIVVLLALLFFVFSFVDVPFASRLIGIQQGLNYSIWK